MENERGVPTVNPRVSREHGSQILLVTQQATDRQFDPAVVQEFVRARARYLHAVMHYNDECYRLGQKPLGIHY